MKTLWISMIALTFAFSSCKNDRSDMLSMEKTLEILDWCKTRDIENNKGVVLDTPPEPAIPAQDKKIYILRRGDQWIFLVKLEVGYKENFEGMLYTSSALEADEYVREANPPYISLEEFPPMAELYVRKDHGDGRFAVYFDLN